MFINFKNAIIYIEKSDKKLINRKRIENNSEGESMFNMFNYLQLKGFNNSELKRHFEKIDEMNENINRLLIENPGTVLKEIKISYLDENKNQIHFDVDFEVINN